MSASTSSKSAQFDDASVTGRSYLGAETKPAVKTTEFVVYVLAVVGVLVASTLVGDTDGRGAARSFDGQPVDVAHGVKDFRPTVYLYDNYPGGVGLSAPLFDLRQQVVERARALVAGCDCSHGCPACIGPILASEEERGCSPKRAALVVLDLLLSSSKEDQFP